MHPAKIDNRKQKCRKTKNTKLKYLIYQIQGKASAVPME